VALGQGRCLELFCSSFFGHTPAHTQQNMPRAPKHSRSGVKPGTSSVVGAGKRPKRDLVSTLGHMHADTGALPLPGKSGSLQLKDNAKSITESCVALGAAELGEIAAKPCSVSTASKDGRGRCQRSMRVGGEKINFRPWHVVWVATNGPAPPGLQYSHRCHNGNCCEPTHGEWEDDATNKNRNSCRTCSHVVLPSGRIILLCPHKPPCLTPVVVSEGDRRSFSSLAEYVSKTD
jgi:hypothetical protein